MDLRKALVFEFPNLLLAVVPCHFFLICTHSQTATRTRLIKIRIQKIGNRKDPKNHAGVDNAPQEPPIIVPPIIPCAKEIEGTANIKVIANTATKSVLLILFKVRASHLHLLLHGFDEATRSSCLWLISNLQSFLLDTKLRTTCVLHPKADHQNTPLHSFAT